MNKKNYAFGKTNFILLAVGMLVVIIGFCLMSGGGSDETVFNPDIFSTMRIKVAPVVCLVGFLSMIVAIMYRSKADDNETQAPKATDTGREQHIQRTTSIQKEEKK